MQSHVYITSHQEKQLW